MSERAPVANATALPVPLMSRNRAGRSSLPRPLTSFIAREQEQQEIIDLLMRDEVRLLSLMGPGGIGKTRLAITIADQLSDQFEQIWFVSLASVGDSHLFLSAIGQVMGIRESQGRSMSKQVADAIGEFSTLLVLDNFEQIVGAGPDLCEVLQLCGAAKALVTTRTLLRVSGEFEYTVPPLSLPPSDAGLSISAVESWPTIRLFLDRARAVNTHFSLTPANVNDVIDICLASDGLPLAIELAAAQLRVFSPRAMRGQLQQRLELLVDGPVDQPERLQTMRDAIRWSYELLSPDQQGLFRCIGLFSGGFTLDAVGSVCLPETCTQLERGRALAGLIDSSLVQRWGEQDGEWRFAMLETVREFAREQLLLDDRAETLREAHARHHLRLAAESEPRLIVSGSAGWVRRLGLERGNLRDAVGWALEQSHPEEVLKLSGTLLSLAYARGEPAESLRWLLDALDDADNASPDLRADALFAASALAQVQGDLENASRLGEQALEVSRTAGYRFGEARALIGLGINAEWANDLNLATELYRNALVIMQDEEHASRLPHWRVLPLANLADIALIQHRYAEAIEVGQQAVDQWRQDGYLWGIAQALGTVAAAQCERGELTSSREAYTEVLDLWLACADGRGISGTIAGIGGLALAFGNPEQAARLLGAADSVRRRLGVQFVAHHLYAQRQIASVRNRLSATEMAAFRAEGEALTVEAAVDHAQRYLAEIAHESRRRYDILSRREIDVLKLVANGLPDREIANALSISPRTVQTHVMSILIKLDARSRAEAVAIAIRRAVI